MCNDIERQLKPSNMEEFHKIEEHYPILASTGCTARFCQSGRMIHTDEPRVGKDRPLHQIEAEAIDFLWQMRRDNLLQSETEYQDRLKEVLGEINRSARITRLTSKDAILKPINGKISSDLTSSGWTQSFEELQYGIRMAWKHSRKCIMRSQYVTLSLCDLRSVKTSAEMGRTLVEKLKEAFNGGEVLPTVFVFPARQAGKSGPMIWNNQLLAFAGYTNDDGSVLGDPMNIDVTSSIIRLGWKPPIFRTEWDLLPIVTMAEGDQPAITEISKEDFPLVHITHPRHELAFEKLGLRWVAAPALSRLGFDIGGVQYTATPFIGWFMDAEIGIRNLADQSRYNVLPNVVKRLYVNEVSRPFDQLPEHERLALLSRAQAELNFAVHHSFLQMRIRMSDALTASASYCRFDDEHFKKRGFRLPADPYWLAPPQGSIIPVWHRGGAPHYQPKPMICRHQEDPVKAWKRREKRHKEISPDEGNETPNLKMDGSYTKDPMASVMVHYCSTGSIAAKLAGAVCDFLKQHCRRNQKDPDILQPQPLDSLDIRTISSEDIVIIVASSCGKGEVPPNGRQTESQLKGTQLPRARFAVFGNGDSSFSDTFNGAARVLFRRFKEAGLRPMSQGYIEGDNATESPPWKSFEAWLQHLPSQVLHQKEHSNGFLTSKIDKGSNVEKWRHTIDSHIRFKLDTTPDKRQNIKKVNLHTSNGSYSAMDHLLVLPPNSASKVRQVLSLLGTHGSKRMASLDRISYFDFLLQFVDLRAPFTDMSWVEDLMGCLDEGVDTKTIRKASVTKALFSLPQGWQKKVDIEDVLINMPAITPRTFSIASVAENSETAWQDSKLELLVQTKFKGKFSDRFLNHAKAGDSFRGRIQPATRLRRTGDRDAGHIVAFVTGSGFAPMQRLLQMRAQYMRETREEGEIAAVANRISLFVGFRGEDTKIIHGGIEEAITLGLLDMLVLMPSNERKERAQDKIFQPGIREHVEAKIKKGAYVFVCANPPAADDFADNLGAILGCNVRTALGEKYVQDDYGTV